MSNDEHGRTEDRAKQNTGHKLIV